MADAWTVVVTRDPEWDDTWRSKVEGIGQFDEDCCTGCGLHTSVTDDLDRHKLMYDDRVCPVCAARDLKNRILEAGDERFAEKHPDIAASKPQPADGRQVFLRQMTDAEVAKQQAPDGDVGVSGRRPARRSGSSGTRRSSPASGTAGTARARRTSSPAE